MVDIKWINLDTIIVLIVVLGGIYLFQGFITEDIFRVIIGIVHLVLAGCIRIAEENSRL